MIRPSFSKASVCIVALHGAQKDALMSGLNASRPRRASTTVHHITMMMVNEYPRDRNTNCRQHRTARDNMTDRNYGSEIGNIV